jgi:quercetin 2,3-dioxygenase
MSPLTDAQWHVGRPLETRGIFSRTSEVMTEILGGDPADELVDVRRQKAYDASHLQELGHVHYVEKSGQITGYDLSDAKWVRTYRLEVQMPAVTVNDLSTLPKVPLPDRALVERPVSSVTTAPQGFEGEGFPVRRAFAGMTMRDLDPFVHMDQMGEVDYAPGEPKGTPWHPHRGFETVTYMIDGTFAHQDSHGGGGLITNGATQWMTAGGGILHIETPPEELVISGGLFHGIQLWVNLPAKSKMIPPAYQNLEAEEVTLLSSADGGSLVRVIAGELGDYRGPGSTHTPMALMHATISPGALLELPWNAGFNALVYVLTGSGRVDGGRRVHSGQLVAFGPGDWVAVRNHDPQNASGVNLEILVLGGQPIREPVEHYGPFVMNTRDEIRQALEDFEAGRLGTIPPNALMPHVPDPDPIRAEHTGI